MTKEYETDEILLEVLNIIEYKEDKNAFIDSFLNNAQKQAALNILDMLPKEKKEELQSQQSNKQLFSEVFTEEVMDKAMVDVMVLQFQGFLQTILPTLSTDKKDKLLNYLDSIAPSN